MNIALTYNAKKTKTYGSETDQSDIEFDSPEVISGIENAIKTLGHRLIKIEANLQAFNKLKKSKNKIDLVFNIAEGLSGDARESQIPLFCEMLNIPYTHSSPTTHALKLNKQLTKYVLDSIGINVPNSQVISTSKYKILPELKFPLIVKPNKQGSSKGIFNDSVVTNHKQLKKAIVRVLENYDDQALVEQYIDGREFTVGMIGTPPRILPVVEQRFDFLPAKFNKIAGYELKWIYEENLSDIKKGYYCPAPITNKIKKQIEESSYKIWNVLEVKDCCRIDYRLNKMGILYFIEINTLPGIIPNENTISYFPLAYRTNGGNFTKLIEELLNSAKKRYQI